MSDAQRDNEVACWWLESVDLGQVRDLGDAVQALASVPDTIIVAGTPVRIWTSLNRDFMPPMPPGGWPLMAIVRVLVEQPAVLPATMRADRIAVVYGEEVWVAPLVEEYPAYRDDSKFEVVARNGPKWGPDVSVDVIVQLRDGEGNVHLARAPGQLIQHSI